MRRVLTRDPHTRPSLPRSHCSPRRQPRVKTHVPCATTHRPRPTMSADASERENETWWIWPVFLEKWLRHASGRSALCAGITFALACIDRSAVMRERSHTGKEKLLGTGSAEAESPTRTKRRKDVTKDCVLGSHRSSGDRDAVRRLQLSDHAPPRRSRTFGTWDIPSSCVSCSASGSWQEPSCCSCHGCRR